MNIHAKGSVTVSGEISSSASLRGLKPGSRIPARILERISPSRALIEIAERRVKAEFTGGIPLETRLTLVLKNIDAGSLVFSLLRGDPQEALLLRLQQFTLLGPDAESIRALHSAGRQLDKTVRSVFECNLLLLLPEEAAVQKKPKIADILNKMAALGVSKELLAVFSYIFSRIGGINLNYFMPFFRLIGIKARFRDVKEADREAETALEALADQLKGLSRKQSDEASKLIGELLEALGHAETPGLCGVRAGAIPYLEEGEFRQLRYLAAEASFMLELELSSLGRVGILARDIKGRMAITVFCEGEAAFQALEGGIRALERELSGNIQRGIAVVLYNGARAVQNIIEIYTSLMLDSVVDIKA